MFSKLIDGWQAGRAVKKLENDPLFGPVLAYGRQALHDRSRGIGQHISDSDREGLMVKLISDLNMVVSQPDPKAMLRIRILDFMILTAKFDVLIIEPPGSFKGITGELKDRILELSKLDGEIEQYFYGLNPSPETFDEMWDAILNRYWVMHFFLNAYNMTREASGDWHSDHTKDWFRACYTSLCIWQESTYRQLLGMAPATDDPKDDLKALMHSTWMQRAQEGHENLRLAWEKSWQEVFDEPSPFAGLEL